MFNFGFFFFVTHGQAELLVIIFHSSRFEFYFGGSEHHLNHHKYANSGPTERWLKAQGIQPETHVFKKKGNEQQFNINRKVIKTSNAAVKVLKSGNIGKVKVELNEGISLLNNRQKIIKLADKSKFGWTTVQEYACDDLADDEADNIQQCETDNFSSKLIKVKKLSDVWSQRDLSLYGKITIAKTLGFSRLIFASACIQPPSYIIDIVTKLLANFVWNRKKQKIKRGTLIGPKEKGGLDLPEYETIIKSLLCTWVKRMRDGTQNGWKKIPSFYPGKVRGTLIFDCSYDIDLLELNGMPAFYIDILKSWAEIKDLVADHQERSNVREFIIWNNKKHYQSG